MTALGLDQDVRTPTRHGGFVPLRPEALLSSDPELELVWADMAAWHEAHPCTCEAGCECDVQE